MISVKGNEYVAIIKQISPDDMHALHRAVLRPEAMVVSIAGQFDETAILALLDKY